MILSVATTPGQSGPGAMAMKGNTIPQRSKTGASPSDCLVSYPGQSLGAEMQSMYSAASANWACKFCISLTQS